ncbi:MAG: CZB domain-containing protein [Proteobacteria bacterium]|nr:CZB domain-containing protein [Pseudomonadota bacterium]
MNLKNLTIGKRIALICIVVIVLFSISGVISSLGVGHIVDNAKQVFSGNKLDGMLAQKEVDHLNWIGTVTAFLNDDNSKDLTVETDHQKCGFGQWLYGTERKDAEQLIPSLTPPLA